MFSAVLSASKQKEFRDKARLNAWIARDLAEGFGGKKAHYLKRLNGKLKQQIRCSRTSPPCVVAAA